MTGCQWRDLLQTLKPTCALWVKGIFGRANPEYPPYIKSSVSVVQVTEYERVHFQDIKYLLRVFITQRHIPAAR